MSPTQQYTFRPQRQEPQASMRRNQNTVKFSIKAGLGPVSNTVMIALMLAVLGLIYLTQITKTSTFGYQLNDLTNRQEELVGENTDLEVEIARMQALEKVQQSDVAAAMTTPASTEYANTN